jgi:ubiquinone/menaquinone biosynthesis C-methylase UbiE
MSSETEQLRRLISGMRAAYAAGGNAMAYAREVTGSESNATLATLLAYDLQTGTYNALARRSPESNARWCHQLAEILATWVREDDVLLEAGCGEATTLAGTLARLPVSPAHSLGFDLSWSRCAEAREWLAENGGAAELFVGDLFSIPLADESIDVVYTSHTVEPNGGREEQALRELLRVTRRVLVLVEPAYERADEEAQARMRQHGYARGLRGVLERLGARVTRDELLPYSVNPRNPSGLLVVEKAPASGPGAPVFQCPLTGAALVDGGEVRIAESMGLVYPVLQGIPLLRPEHAVVASRLELRVSRP